MKLGNFCKIAVISACWAVFLGNIQAFPSVFRTAFLGNCGGKDFPYEPYQVVAVWWLLIPVIAIAVGVKLGRKESIRLDRFFEFSLTALGACIVIYQSLTGWIAIHPCLNVPMENTSPFMPPAWLLQALFLWAISVPFVAIAFGAWWFFQKSRK